MSDRLKLVLFDCDGTLVDSQHMIVAAMHHAFDAHDLPLLEREKVLSIVGLSLFEAVGTLLGPVDPKLLASVVDGYKNAFTHLRGQPDLHEPLYEGALDALDALAQDENLLLGVATGKSQKGLQNILALHGIRDRFVTLQTADDAPSKPHPAMVQQAMAATGVRPENTIVIGDTTFDIQMARNAGAHALGVDWGYHQSADLFDAGASRVLEGFGEVPEAVTALWRAD